MICKRSVVTGAILLLVVGSVGLAFSQDAAATAPADTAAGAAPANVTATTPETQWIWGEVVSIDAGVKTVTIKYPDYETDQEKNMVVAAGDATTYESVKSFDEIKVGDTLSIDYTSSADGKVMAKNISVEKPEAAKPAEAAVPPTEPAEATTGNTTAAQ